MVKTLHITFLLTIAIVFTASGQEDSVRDSIKINRKVRFLPLPTLGYAPETCLYFGGVGLLLFQLYPDSNSRPSNAKVEITISTKKQIMLDLEWNHFFRQEKWLTRGNFHVSKYPDVYYGIGAQVEDTAKVTYNSNRIMVQFSFLGSTRNSTFIGPIFRYINYSKLEYINGSTRSFSELEASSVAGLGITFLKDKRNNLLNSTSGYYGEITASANLFKESLYSKILIDIRYYKSFTINTLAFRLLNENSFGQPPFYDYCFLGGDRTIRGYYYGQFRDRDLLDLQAEYRLKVIWRLGIALFSGLGIIYDKTGNITNENIKPNFGGGIRFHIDRKNDVNLRFDYAIGLDGSSGFYVAFGESF